MRICGGELRGRSIRTLPEAQGYRPATARVREAVFNMLTARGVRFAGCRVADLFAGSGSLGIEALSRGAVFALFVDKNRRAAELITRNLRELGVEPGRWAVLCADLLSLAKKPPRGGGCDIIFIDPPYGQNLLGPALDMARTDPWLRPGGLLLAETEASLGPAPEVPGLDLDVDRTYGQTRITLWRKLQTEPPSTPEPSTP